jgi:hypothetical protein
MIAGLAVGDETMAFPLKDLRVARVVNERVGGVRVLVIHQQSSETATAFEARAKGKVLRFRAGDADTSTVVDLETRSWSQFRPGTRLFTASRDL